MQSPQSSQSSNNYSSHNNSNPHVIQYIIVVNLQNIQGFNETRAKKHMMFLASVLESYESLIAGRIRNPNMTKEDYDQIDPKELELIDIKWCMASVIRRAQRFMEITGMNSLRRPNLKLGFDKSKVTCFKCKEKGHFKHECTNREVNNSSNPFGGDYYKRAIYQKNSQHTPNMSRPISIEDGSSKSKDKALVVTQGDEGFN
ncbi:putative transcription factor interactor and regulator CCHC(Zn) family [Helianthus annuus]|uniref:Transcription factor interactor and regulator CCHC(Zn) family n=1 Tax=Helianthus annuus TaxID=4232 RepID=A0A9K3I4M1_HELAN|nr:putative transcription factor interactor and regulator CCHC(Zn) family [Helianthus annuus]